jgi:hypothetical protein
VRKRCFRIRFSLFLEEVVVEGRISSGDGESESAQSVRKTRKKLSQREIFPFSASFPLFFELDFALLLHEARDILVLVANRSLSQLHRDVVCQQAVFSFTRFRSEAKKCGQKSSKQKVRDEKLKSRKCPKLTRSPNFCFWDFFVRFSPISMKLAESLVRFTKDCNQDFSDE